MASDRKKKRKRTHAWLSFAANLEEEKGVMSSLLRIRKGGGASILNPGEPRKRWKGGERRSRSSWADATST